MKAITLHQPWASLVALGAKRFETRGWQIRYRGPIAIHAAKNFPKWEWDCAIENPRVLEALRSRGGIEDPGKLPLGSVIATAVLHDVCPTGAVLATREVSIAMDEFWFGDFSDGRFAWELREVRLLPVPIPARGMQRLWNWDGGPSQLA